MKAYYMEKDKIMTEIEITDEGTVNIKNFSDDIMKLAFGVKTNPSIKDFERLIERRIIPKNRANLSRYLATIGLLFYDPMQIVRKTRGVSFSDFFWIKFEGDLTTYEDIVRWKTGDWDGK